MLSLSIMSHTIKVLNYTFDWIDNDFGIDAYYRDANKTLITTYCGQIKGVLEWVKGQVEQHQKEGFKHFKITFTRPTSIDPEVIRKMYTHMNEITMVFIDQGWKSYVEKSIYPTVFIYYISHE